MKFMKLGSRPDCFQNDGKDNRFVTADLAADIIVHVGNVKFYLHKFPLLSKSYRMQKLLATTNSDEVDEICIPDIPGGASAFEICAKFCYGMTVTLNAHNVAAARCAAEYLEMHDTMEKGNLIYKIEVFLRTSIFRSWKDSVVVLQTTRFLLPWAEDLKLINHCIDSIASKASIHSSKVEWSYTYNRKKNGVRKENQVPDDWWVEDLCELEIDFFSKIILAIKAKGRASFAVIGEALKAYTYWRFSSSGKRSVRHGGDAMNASFLETIIRLLPSEKACVSCSFLLKLLRAGCLLSCSEMDKKELVKRIGHCLEDASVPDLLIPITSEKKTIYDVDMILRIVKEFMMQEDNEANPTVTEEHQELSVAALASGPSKIAVAKLVDGCLVEIAKDPNLPLSKFMDLAEILPCELRPLHDELYGAIDTYLKEHPGLSKSEKKMVCGLVNCKKLSVDVCTHAVQNERLPLRMVVQVLYFEQMRVSTSTASQAESGGSYGSSKSAITTNTEDEHDLQNTPKAIELSSDETRRESNGHDKIGNRKMKGMETVAPPMLRGVQPCKEHKVLMA
ncbi:BTB/POZ domain-containing protein NPY4-like [Canna indica]|uniref:BTB/POZ domain-containing protein NPY4-like n=1 Tax=Canna indica TaxID=4628 RepID=A0AAQ3QLC1_9LILI|nr:BTB/POZ domain-containing protein NPY4-like [Canna indica]